MELDYKKMYEKAHDFPSSVIASKSNSWITWLEKQGEQKLCMIQWKGDNLKEVIGFTGKNKNFDKWFTSFEEYERYVHEHNNIFKLFNEDGSHYEVPVGAWIVKTPDGYNVASKAVLKQKPADKVEPKFKVGDWVRAISSGNIFKILSVNDGLYRVLCYDGVEANYPIEDVDYDLAYWAIQDAKDGDVLATESWLYIFKYTNNKNIIQFHCNCPINVNPLEWSFSFDESYLDIYIDANIHPATKEQRELLFQKMKEAGYEWDTEKKELRKIEQTSTWSEEDEERIEFLIAMCNDEQAECVNNSTMYRECTETKDWLNSLKDRVQPKQEWSEEDERIINDAIWLIEHYATDGHKKLLREQTIDKLKSIKPNHWKPSEEQMKWLKDVIDTVPMICR